MKVTTSVQISEDLLAAVDERARCRNEDRSSVIEAAVRAFIVPPAPESSKADLQILNQQADRLNLEAEDVLAYQVFP
jgi:metal-responsive CopG/Arc/MetJ family transcriptional regulator